MIVRILNQKADTDKFYDCRNSCIRKTERGGDEEFSLVLKFTSGGNIEVVLDIEMDVTELQGLALQAMFEYWNALASMGGSRKVGFYVDGDGNFKPNCNVKFEKMTPKLTDEMRKISIVEEEDGNRTYDFDPVAWKLHDLKEKEESEVRDGYNG